MDVLDYNLVEAKDEVKLSDKDILKYEDCLLFKAHSVDALQIDY